MRKTVRRKLYLDEHNNSRQTFPTNTTMSKYSHRLFSIGPTYITMATSTGGGLRFLGPLTLQGSSARAYTAY